MSSRSRARRSRHTEYNSRLHLAAVISVIAGAGLLVGAAFLLSYTAIHEIALTEGVSPSLAGLYPLLLDAALVIACVAALALRGAPWWMRCYAALSILILLAALAVGAAMHSAGLSLPRRPTAAALAAIPWVLFLVAFGLGLSVFRYRQKMRVSAPADDEGAESGLVSEPAAGWPTVDRRDDWPGFWDTGRRTADFDVVRPEPQSASSGQDYGTSAVEVTPASGAEHRHGSGHWHQRGDDPDGN